MKRYNRPADCLTIVQIAPDYYPVPPPAYGGIERVVHTLTEQLVRLGHRVILYAPEGSASSAELIPYTHGMGNPQAIRDTVIRTLPENVDIIHDHTHTSVMGRLKLPLLTVCTLHASVNNDIDQPVYISESSLRTAGNNIGCFIYNGIDPEDFDFSDQKSDYLLFMGVISPHKGVHHALQIAEALGRRLIVAGPVFNMDYFRTEIEPALRRNSKLEYVGEVGGADKRRLLKEAQCMLFPTCCDEAFGLVMVEAMASGTPVLALANGSVPEVMCGFPELICGTVEEMMKKAERGNYPDSSELRAYALRRFSHEEMARQYVQLYRRLLEDSERETGGAEKENGLQREDVALRLYESVLEDARSSLDQKLQACNDAAEIWRSRGMIDKEKSYIFRTFEYAAPRAEFCCRLGYIYLQEEDYAKSAFWYHLATQLEPPTDRTSFYIDACWSWLPYVQLCVCNYHLGNLEAAYRHNETARTMRPEDPLVLNNKSFLEPLVIRDRPASDDWIEVEISGADAATFRMALQLPGFIEETIRDKGAWEPGLAKLLARYMQSGGIFVDVGANIGFHTLYIASLGNSAQCVSFEPHPELCSQLRANAKLSGFANISVHEHAISDRSGSIDFYQQAANVYNRGLSGATISNSEDQNHFTLTQVNAMTLDEAFSGQMNERICAIKIDTQGFEYEALRGAAETIRRSKPLIAFEYHAYGTHSLEQILSLLSGYDIYKLQVWTGELRRLDEDDPEGFEQDYICISRDS